MPKYGVNKAILLGNVGTQPELRFLDQGVAVCTFRMATTERIRSSDGSTVDRTDWHNIVLWRKRAEIANQYLKVGSGVYVEGRIVTRSWDGPDGAKRYKTEIEVEKLRILDITGSGEAGNPVAQEKREQVPNEQNSFQKESNESFSNEPDDDLPF